jgi:hypothetical protein
LGTFESSRQSLADVEPRFETLNGEEPVEVIVGDNLKRRN